MKTVALAIFGLVFYNGIIFPYLLFNQIEKILKK
jgi:hypothetical protein